MVHSVDISRKRIGISKGILLSGENCRIAAWDLRSAPSGAPQRHPPAETPPLGLCTRAPRAVQLGQAAQDGAGPLGDPRGGRPRERRAVPDIADHVQRAITGDRPDDHDMAQRMALRLDSQGQ